MDTEAEKKREEERIAMGKFLDMAKNKGHRKHPWTYHGAGIYSHTNKADCQCSRCKRNREHLLANSNRKQINQQKGTFWQKIKNIFR